VKLLGKSLILLVVVLAAGWILLGRVPRVPEPPPARPALTYSVAVARIDSIRAHEGPAINPECHTRLIGPGSRTARVLVILHGFTNCPKQFDPMARDFARQGYNVYVPLLPRHGMADRMTDALSRLTAAELVRAGEDAVDIAAGLGDRITVMGLSSSAVLTGWLAERRPEVACAVLIAPSLAPRSIPEPPARRLTRVLLALPNFFVWWDSKQRADLLGPNQCYPRFASRALAEVYRLGFLVLDTAARKRPKAKAVVLITTPDDEGVNRDAIFELARRWRARGADVRTYDFPESLHVRHDMIDPDQPYQQVAITYPVIESLVVRCSGD